MSEGLSPELLYMLESHDLGSAAGKFDSAVHIIIRWPKGPPQGASPDVMNGHRGIGDMLTVVAAKHSGSRVGGRPFSRDESSIEFAFVPQSYRSIVTLCVWKMDEAMAHVFKSRPGETYHIAVEVSRTRNGEP